MTSEEREILSYHGWRQSITVNSQLKTPGRIKETLWSHIGMPDNLKGKNFLDVGSNDGMFCFIAESKGARVFGSDLYKEDLTSMREGWPLTGVHLLKKIKQSNITLHHRGIYFLEEINEKMDVVLCSNVINWLDEIEKGIGQLCAVTRGELIISDGFIFNNDEPRRETQTQLRYMYNIKYIEKTLAQNGFRLKSATPLNAYENFLRSYAQTVRLRSDKEIKLYNFPSTDSPFDTLDKIDTTVDSTYGDFYFIQEKGWVHKQDVSITPNKLSIAYRLCSAIGMRRVFLNFKENQNVKRTGIKAYRLIATKA